MVKILEQQIEANETKPTTIEATEEIANFKQRTEVKEIVKELSDEEEEEKREERERRSPVVYQPLDDTQLYIQTLGELLLLFLFIIVFFPFFFECFEILTEPEIYSFNSIC